MNIKNRFLYVILTFLAAYSLHVKAITGQEIPALNFDNYTIESYADQDIKSTVTIEDNGNTLRIVGNSWKKISLPYSVTENTVLEFDYYSNIEGEIQGIGIAPSSDLNQSQTFRLYGTQNWGLADFADYANSAPGLKHYVIPIGQYYTGTHAYMFFTNDDDANSAAESVFKNVKIYEDVATSAGALDFNSSTTISSYGDQDVSGSVSIEDNGNKLRLVGNSWKKISLPYNVTPNTVLEFVYYSGNQGEIQGIGMSKTNNQNESQTFQLYGTQNFGVSDYADYANSVPNSKRYVIPIGQYFTGTQAYLFFANDDDANNGAESIFKDVKIYESGTVAALDFSSTTISSYGDQDVSGSVSIEDNGNKLRLVGNTWKKIALPYNITPNTVLEFVYYSGNQGEIQGIGMSSINSLNLSQ
ncbi:MAG: hypothetical protein KAI77_00320, partial [Gammaproteobacteria bacterium]|nr:hypothetical protein [Gammaproteobacteria bacterium]